MDMRYLLAFIFILIAITAHANTATLEWDASPPEGVEGYIIYYGTDPANFDYIKPVGNVLTTEITQLPPGEWFFTVTAYSSAVESGPTNTVSKVIPAFIAPDPVEHEPINIVLPPGGNLTINVNMGQ